MKNKKNGLFLLISILTFGISCQSTPNDTIAIIRGNATDEPTSTSSSNSNSDNGIQPVASPTFIPGGPITSSATIVKSSANPTLDINDSLFLTYDNPKQYSGGTPEKRFISIMDLDGSNSKTLRRFDGIEYFSWSPDSKKIMFVSPENNLNYIYTMDTEGKLDQVMRAEKPTDLPSWFPDSEKIAVRSETDGIIYMYNADGTNKVQIIDFKKDYKLAGYPNISPDGKIIAYTDWENGGGAKQGYNLHTVYLDGTQRKIIPGTGTSSGVWTKDSKNMVLNNGSSIRLLNLDTGNITVLKKDNIATYQVLDNKIVYVTKNKVDKKVTYKVKSMNLEGADDKEISNFTYDTEQTFRKDESLEPSSFSIYPNSDKVLINQAMCWNAVKNSKEISLCYDDNRPEVAGETLISYQFFTSNIDGSNKKLVGYRNGVENRGAVADISPDGKKIMFIETFVRRETYVGLGDAFINSIEGYPANYFQK